MSIDLERARFNMVEQQIRPWDVLDTKVLDLLHKVKREEFVPSAYQALAFADLEIPIGLGEKMLSPKLEARILQELAIHSTDRILEVGTGSGYLTALLASQGAHVYSVDIVDAFIQVAGERLAQHGLHNVTLEQGDAARGWDKHGPYDVVVLTGSVPVLAESFQQSLTAAGRLFAIVGEAPAMEARLITCMGTGAPGAYSTASLFETSVPALRNAPQHARFSF
ncbi:MAG TPA: protein-L-isoaspartate O-methyltransferase [Burkholderiales bacterium]|nr:protein-L-isoaspartate O-methyltransferase [Burkholderiales bacterium]